MVTGMATRRLPSWYSISPAPALMKVSVGVAESRAPGQWTIRSTAGPINTVSSQYMISVHESPTDCTSGHRVDADRCSQPRVLRTGLVDVQGRVAGVRGWESRSRASQARGSASSLADAQAIAAGQNAGQQAGRRCVHERLEDVGGRVRWPLARSCRPTARCRPGSVRRAEPEDRGLKGIDVLLFVDVNQHRIEVPVVFEKTSSAEPW